MFHTSRCEGPTGQADGLAHILWGQLGKYTFGRRFVKETSKRTCGTRFVGPTGQADIWHTF